MSTNVLFSSIFSRQAAPPRGSNDRRALKPHNRVWRLSWFHMYVYIDHQFGGHHQLVKNLQLVVDHQFVGQNKCDTNPVAIVWL